MREVEHLSRLYIAHQFVMAEVIWSMLCCQAQDYH